jgi:FdhD protein
MTSTNRSPDAARKMRVQSWSNGRQTGSKIDRVVVEEPLEIRVDTHSIGITMRTPGHDEELVAGFLYTEGLIHGRNNILKIGRSPRNRMGNVLDLFLCDDSVADFCRLRRHGVTSASCGVCGRESIRAIQSRFPPVSSTVSVEAQTLLKLPERMKLAQTTFHSTGGVHAAAIFNNQGELIVAREDVGRHNAVDKALGHCLLEDKLPLDSSILMLSGRVSIEILHKALAFRVPIIAAISAPSSLAVQFARRSNQTLIGFLRGTQFNAYSGTERVLPASLPDVDGNP